MFALRRADVGARPVGQRVQVETLVAERTLAAALVKVLARLHTETKDART